MYKELKETEEGRKWIEKSEARIGDYLESKIRKDYGDREHEGDETQSGVASATSPASPPNSGAAKIDTPIAPNNDGNGPRREKKKEKKVKTRQEAIVETQKRKRRRKRNGGKDRPATRNDRREQPWSVLVETSSRPQ